MDIDRVYQVVDDDGSILAQVHSWEEAKEHARWRIIHGLNVLVRALDVDDTRVIGHTIEGVPSMPDDDDGIEDGIPFTVRSV